VVRPRRRFNIERTVEWHPFAIRFIALVSGPAAIDSTI
jgi:hypothetical protein